MPYEIKKMMEDGKMMQCVMKKDGSKVKCHPTMAQAKKHMAALYANEAKEAEIAQKAADGAGDEAEVKSLPAEGMHEKMYEEHHRYVPYGVTTFAELQAAREASEAAVEMSSMANDLQDLLANRMNMIMVDETVTDKAAAIVTSLEELAGELAGLVETEAQDMEMEKEASESIKDWLAGLIKGALKAKKTEGGEKFPASDYLVAEDPDKPSTWHLQVKRHGKPDRGLAGAAWAALFSPGGHRGNKYAGPDTEGAKKRLRALYKAQVWEEPKSKEAAGFMVWKEADGTYRWLARYSNNRRDQDNPPEIISDKSHRRFDEMLSKGEALMPELWLWHVPEWKWGRTTWHAYDDSGFPMAAGVVDRGKEAIAEHLMALDPALVRVSHGMPTKSIVRDEADESVIVGHVTREISPLPAWAAANQLTGFTILKEATDMAIPQDKRDALKTEWNLTDELLSKLEAANVEQAKEADEAGIEKKEVETTETTAAPTEPEVTQEASAEAPLTRAEMQAVLQQIGAAIAGLTEQVKALSGAVVEVKEQKAVEEAETLSEMFERAIKHPDTRVRKNAPEAKDRPAETKPPVPEIVNSGHPLADHVINNLVSGKWLEQLQQLQQSQD